MHLFDGSSSHNLLFDLNGDGHRNKNENIRNNTEYFAPSSLYYCQPVTMSEETAFPRGKTRLITAEAAPNKAGKDQKKREKPENDILFGQKHETTDSAKTSRKKRKTEATAAASGATSLVTLGGGGVIAPNQKQKEALIESISFQKLAKGTKLFGIVREINDKFALVSLPNLLTGYILAKEVR